MFRARILLKVCSKSSYTYIHVPVHVCCVSVSYMYYSISTWDDNSMMALHFNTKVQIISLNLWPYFSYNLQGTTLNNILVCTVQAHTKFTILSCNFHVTDKADDTASQL